MSTVTLSFKGTAFVDSRPPVATAGQPSEEQLRLWLVNYLARLVDAHPADIETRQSFASYGLGSLSAVRMAGDLETWLKREIPATLAWDYPTIEDVIQFLATGAAQ